MGQQVSRWLDWLVDVAVPGVLLAALVAAWLGLVGFAVFLVVTGHWQAGVGFLAMAAFSATVFAAANA